MLINSSNFNKQNNKMRIKRAIKPNIFGLSNFFLRKKSPKNKSINLIMSTGKKIRKNKTEKSKLITLRQSLHIKNGIKFYLQNNVKDNKEQISIIVDEINQIILVKTTNKISLFNGSVLYVSAIPKSNQDYFDIICDILYFSRGAHTYFYNRTKKILHHIKISIIAFLNFFKIVDCVLDHYYFFINNHAFSDSNRLPLRDFEKDISVIKDKNLYELSQQTLFSIVNNLIKKVDLLDYDDFVYESDNLFIYVRESHQKLYAYVHYSKFNVIYNTGWSGFERYEINKQKNVVIQLIKRKNHFVCEKITRHPQLVSEIRKLAKFLQVIER